MKEKFEPYQPTPEDQAEIKKSRTLSDAELLKDGAEYKNGILTATEKQLNEAKKEMDINAPEMSKIENISEYEREKIERTLNDAKRIVAVIENYLEMIKFCDEQGIDVIGRTSLNDLRRPNGPAGPNSDLGKIARIFESGQTEIAKNLTKEQVNQIYEERIKPKEQKNQRQEEVIKDPVLFDLYRHADDFRHYKNRSLDDIKRTAKEIAQELYELGATDKLSPDSNLGQAYINAHRIMESYKDVEQARLAIIRIADLIHESEGFRDSAKAWEKSKG